MQNLTRLRRYEKLEKLFKLFNKFWMKRLAKLLILGVRLIYAREIFDFASDLCGGELSETVMMTLCRAAAAELKQRLREGVSAGEIKELFVAAAGVLALSMYMAAGARPAVTSFKAGNLSVSCAGGGGSVSAAALRKTAESMLASYLRDEGFGFLGVRG